MPKDKKSRPDDPVGSGTVSVEWVSALQARVEVLEANTVTKEEFTALIALEEKTNANLQGEILELKAALTVDESRINELVDMLAQTGDVLNARIDEANAKRIEFSDVFKAEADKTKAERDLLSGMINDLRAEIETKLVELPTVLRDAAKGIDKVIDKKIDRLRSELKGTDWVSPADLGPSGG